MLPTVGAPPAEHRDLFTALRVEVIGNDVRIRHHEGLATVRNNETGPHEPTRGPSSRRHAGRVRGSHADDGRLEAFDQVRQVLGAKGRCREGQGVDGDNQAAEA